MDDFSTKFKKGLSLLVCISTSATSTNVLYINSRASLHMTRVCKNFTDLIERDVNLKVVLGDDSIVRVVGIGIVFFQRESQPIMLVRDVIYVLRLKKNLISVSTIEDKGYEVVFHDGKVLMYPRGSNITSSKVIRV